MKRLNSIFALATLAIVVGGCAGGAASTSTPGPSPSPSTLPVPVTTPEAAAARVAEVVPELAGIGPKDPNLIGGCCFWEARSDPRRLRGHVRGRLGRLPGRLHRAPSLDVQRLSRRRRSPCSPRPDRPFRPASPAPVAAPQAGSSRAAPESRAGSLLVLLARSSPSTIRPATTAPWSAQRSSSSTPAGQKLGGSLTDAGGNYAVALPAGQYTIEPQPVDGFMRPGRTGFGHRRRRCGERRHRVRHRHPLGQRYEPRPRWDAAQ